MFDHGDLSERWHDAVERASFAFYEPSNGTGRWAGGFASDGSQIEVIAVVDGVEVSVETSADSALPDGARRRHAISEMLWRHALQRDAQLTLPYSVTIEADDRPATVEGEIYTVPGMRVVGDPRWIGHLRLGDVMVKIMTTSSAPLVLRACADATSLPEMPPPGH